MNNRLEALTRWLFLIFIYVMPFTNAFAITGTITLPVIVGILLFFIMLIKLILYPGIPKGFFGFDLILVACFISVVLISYCINGLGNAKSLNHTIAYSTAFLVFYTTIKFTLFSLKDANKTIKTVLHAITITCIISGVFTDIEFMLNLLFHFNINDFIPRPTAEDMFYYPNGLDMFIRARGFASESGHYAFMVELFGPLVAYYLYFSGLCNWKKWLKNFVFILIGFSLVFTLSTSPLIVWPITAVACVLFFHKAFYNYLKKRLLTVLVTSMVIGLIFLLLNYYFSAQEFILGNFLGKFQTNSYYDRMNRNNFFFEHFARFDLIHKLIGVGPAGYSLLGFDMTRALITLYYNTAFELGILGLTILVLFLAYGLIKILQIKKTIAIFLFISLVGAALHYYIISNYWFPWYWFVLAFAFFVEKNKNQLESKS
jgi:hypothetical protein